MGEPQKAFKGPPLISLGVVRVAENPKRNEEFERLAYEYQLLQAQAQLLAQNLELLNLAKNELLALRETLEGIMRIDEEESEILVPIGGGSFLRGILADKEKAIVSMGAGYSAEIPVENAIELTKRRISEYEIAIQKTQEGLRKIELQLQELAKKVQSLQR